MDKTWVIPASIAEELLGRWQGRLYLHSYQFRLRYMQVVAAEDGTLCRGSCLEVTGSAGQEFEIEVEWCSDFDRLRETIIHELLHVWSHVENWTVQGKTNKRVRLAISASQERSVRFALCYVLQHSKSKFADKDLRKQAEAKRCQAVSK